MPNSLIASLVSLGAAVAKTVSNINKIEITNVDETNHKTRRIEISRNQRSKRIKNFER